MLETIVIVGLIPAGIVFGVLFHLYDYNFTKEQ